MTTPGLVLLDYACVIARPQTRDAYERLVALTGLDTETYDVNVARARDDYDLGRVTSTDYWSAVVGRALQDEVVRELVEVETASWMHLDRELLEIVNAFVERGGVAALLSNLPLELSNAVRESGQLGHFSRLFFSFELDLIKPDHAIFSHVLREMGVDAGDVLFVDDRADNIAAARELGLGVLHWTGDDPYRRLRVSLAG